MYKYFLIAFFFVSCVSQGDESRCSYEGIDYVFVSHFENCIMVVSQYHMGNEKVSSAYFANAIICLHAITGIEDNVYRGDSMGYMTKEDFFKDINAWSDWFVRNKKQFSLSDAKEKFIIYEKANKEKIDWPEMLLNQ